MINWVKHFIWFIRESYKYMAGHRNYKFWLQIIPKSCLHACFMRKWDKMSPQQKEAWYLSGKGRTFEINVDQFEALVQ